MASTPVQGTDLDGLFKRRYAEKVEGAVPDFAFIAKKIKFKSSTKMGDDYQQTVKLARGYGATYAGGSTATEAFTLNDSYPLVMKPARVSACSYTDTAQLAYTTVLRSEGSDQAFNDSMDEVVMDIVERAGLSLEATLLYGGTSLAAISSVSGSSTTRTWTITAETWAPGLWSQAVGMALDVYDAAFAGKINTNALVRVTGFNVANKTISVSGNATDLTNILATHVLVPVGAYNNWFSGIDKIATNTGSLFGIDAGTYSLWKSESVAVTGALTLSKVGDAAGVSMVKSGPRDLTCLCSTYTWQDINKDAAALREVTSKGDMTSFEIGADVIKYRGPNMGKIEIVPHPMVKAGEAFLLDFSLFDRLGSTEFTFNLGHGIGDKFIRHLDGKDGFEIRGKWDQALLCRRPSHIVKLTGITNTSA